MANNEHTSHSQCASRREVDNYGTPKPPKIDPQTSAEKSLRANLRVLRVICVCCEFLRVLRLHKIADLRATISSNRLTSGDLFLAAWRSIDNSHLQN